MPHDSTGSKLPSDEREIVPIPFDPHREHEQPPRRSRKLLLRWIFASIGLGLVVLAWFTFTATPVRIEVEPEGAEISLPETLLIFRLGERYLLRPVEHAVRIEREGYTTLETSIEVEGRSDQSFAFTLTKLPGRLRIRTAPITGARVRIDGTDVGETPLLSPDLTPGPTGWRSAPRRYLLHVGQVEVEGEGKEQVVDIELAPAWANITLSTVRPAPPECRRRGRAGQHARELRGSSPGPAS